ncbi:ankyrin repeat domain-containing protein [Leptospira borgpetersenii]|uniref:ankyrin repeat domain-containing protein n=1 Tax=Leptospira borgpetersenii TaxID=174 RepID=UPI000297D379|nr:ankyrin repeat domain-containing protein [Leptospira borgpetersenii]EKR00043.1 ankyrin repeat protein [Leptospira borgpetersenii serovar Castellonis str. 200801910]KGE24682.1 ankryin [Leptospira borgpetersenii serovar Ballum]MBE8161622.1 ankyrin repeat domain-containing protein [Leptospira borgpetersenii serovar Ballum]MBE8164894.1 ankyrin repeat domain-containing protein [Leptospira borgpetersenii serovar Ballum]MBE8170317.1 ankyrin repeat domain-containing protein [Leptospira borgpetersen
MKKKKSITKKWIGWVLLYTIGFSTFLFSKEVSKDKNQLLFDAVVSENLTEIKRLLDLGADPNSILHPCRFNDSLGQSINYQLPNRCFLWDLVFELNLTKALPLLIQKGLKATYERSYVGDVLSFAIYLEKLEIVQILLQHGFKDNDGIALEIAAVHCNLPILKLLLKSGLDPNASKGRLDLIGSSLAGAAYKDCSSAAVELIQAGADVNKLITWGLRLPIERAIESGARDVYFVLKKAKAEFNPETGLNIAKEKHKETEREIKGWEKAEESEVNRKIYNHPNKEQELKHLNGKLEKYNDIIKDLESTLKNRK